MKMFTERLLSLNMLMTLVVGVGRAAVPNIKEAVIRIQQFRSTVLAVITILVVGTIRPLLGSVAPQIRYGPEIHS